MQVRPADEKLPVSAQPERVVRVNREIVHPARSIRTLDRGVGGAELAAALDAHRGHVQPFARVAHGHAVGQPSERVPDGRGGEGIDGVGQTEGNRHLAEAGKKGRPVEIAEQDICPPYLDPVPFQIGVGTLPEALFRIEQHHRVAGNPVAEHGREAKLRRMDHRFGHLLPDLVAGGRMTHQVAELIGPVAGLETCDRGHRSLHVHAVQRERTRPLAAEDQALLVIDGGGPIEDFVAVIRIATDIPGCRAFRRPAGGLRPRLVSGSPFALELVDFPAKLPVFLFESVEALDQPLERLGIGGAGR